MNCIQERILSFNQTWFMKIRVWIPGKSGSGYGFAWEYSPEESLNSIFSQLFYKFDFENCDFLI